MNYIAKMPITQSSEGQISGILRLLRPLLRLSEQTVRNTQSESDDVTPAMKRILMRLQISGPETVPALARALGTGRQHIQRMVNVLLSQKMVERLENPAHKKSMLIALTGQGHAHLEQATDHAQNALQMMSDGFSSDELETCLDVLGRLMDKIGKDSEVQQPQPVTTAENEEPPAVLEPIQAMPQAIEPAPESEPALETDGISEQDMPHKDMAQPAVFNWNGGGGLSIG